MRDCVPQTGHYGGTESCGCWQRENPSDDDVSEERPVNVIARSHTARKHDRADLAVGATDW